MGRIAVHEFITLDGVIDNPGWFGRRGVTEQLMATSATTGLRLVLDRCPDGLGPTNGRREVQR